MINHPLQDSQIVVLLTLCMSLRWPGVTRKMGGRSDQVAIFSVGGHGVFKFAHPTCFIDKNIKLDKNFQISFKEMTP